MPEVNNSLPSPPPPWKCSIFWHSPQGQWACTTGSFKNPENPELTLISFGIFSRQWSLRQAKGISSSLGNHESARYLFSQHHQLGTLQVPALHCVGWLSTAILSVTPSRSNKPTTICVHNNLVKLIITLPPPNPIWPEAFLFLGVISHVDRWWTGRLGLGCLCIWFDELIKNWLAPLFKGDAD